MKKAKSEKQVAFHDNIVSKENLPYPYVYYPGFYGSFFCFSEKKNSTLFFCSCAKEAIENFIRFQLSNPKTKNAYPHRMFFLDSGNFPLRLVNNLISKNIEEDANIINHLQFKHRLCHECNGVIPSFKYCVEMYGTAFKQNFGWYINKQAYEYGIQPHSYSILLDKCPNEILELFEIMPNEYKLKYEALRNTNYKEASKYQQDYLKQIRKVFHPIENEVRRKFGHKKIGEAWTSETILYYIICSLFPDFEIKRHYRPKFLNGLELDIFIPKINLGIEYQGIQHFKPILHWGGKESFEKTKQNDLRKKEICQANNIHLVYFYYSEGLSDEIVKNKISSFICA